MADKHHYENTIKELINKRADELEEMVAQLNPHPEPIYIAPKKEYNYWIFAIKTAGILILFFSWLLEHSGVHDWENRNFEYLKHRVEILSALGIMHDDNLRLAMHYISVDLNKHDTNYYKSNYLTAVHMYDADVTSLMSENNNLFKLHTDTAGMAPKIRKNKEIIDSTQRLIASAFNARDINMLSWIKIQLDDNIDMSTTYLAMQKTIENQILLEYDELYLRFKKWYILGAMLTGIAYVFETTELASWLRILRAWIKKKFKKNPE